MCCMVAIGYWSLCGVWLLLVTGAICQHRSKEEEDKERQENNQSGEEGDERSGKDGPQGPWRSMQSSGAAAATPVAAPPPAKETGNNYNNFSLIFKLAEFCIIANIV